jgi:hypothetical protein
MNLDLILSNILSPPILFFFMGVFSKAVRSDLTIPQPIPKLLSLYLLFAIGFKGGVELSHSGISTEIFLTLLVAVVMAAVTPLYSFLYLRRRLNIYDAGAVAATYGSISAVTFITAISFLETVGIDYGGHMVAAMALMESPAIVVGVLLIRMNLKKEEQGGDGLGSVVKEAMTNGSVVMILGSLLIGVVVSEEHVVALQPFTDDIFKGVLTLFLLDMGLLAGKRLQALKRAGWRVVLFGIWLPLFNAALGILIGHFLGLPEGNTLLLTVLLASASYIAVPAAIRMAVPEANPGLFVPLALAVTFPFNIIIGIPLYYQLIEMLAAL